MTSLQCEIRRLVISLNREQKDHALRELELRQKTWDFAGYRYRKELARYAGKVLREERVR